LRIYSQFEVPKGFKTELSEVNPNFCVKEEEDNKSIKFVKKAFTFNNGILYQYGAKNRAQVARGYSCC